ncbi:autotransporter outer membrane beta-barrel domain-containing protein [Stenotrophomonas sp. JAI102]|uniref:autotransporter outer membrane beta-barrel domain-containing protein n=1 Tax=Stenotrophomonas sp. JAI102 TaxID=2723077 RepID=UPI0015CE1703|nr:autotransporter family porin [Stenotrophomonas sp. JAI102]
MNAGDAAELWVVNPNGTLNVTPGGQTLTIEATEGTVNLVGAEVNGASGGVYFTNAVGDIRNSSIVSASFAGIVTAADAGSSQPTSSVSVADSTVTSPGYGIAVAGGGAVNLVRTEVAGLDDGSTGASGGGVGIAVLAGTAIVAGQSEVRGDRNGVVMTLVTAGAPSQTDSSLTVDNALVEGGSGSAIAVRFDGETTNSTIYARNGARLIGGNGNILEVEGGSTANFNVESSALTGNVINDATSTTHVNLSNNASITGVFDNVTSAALAGGGRWELAGDSDVGALTLGGGGTVALGDGTAFNTLTVSGDYVGAGGTLLFNAVLGDDASASDKLIIGGSTSGQTNVAVNNVGGAGAQTVNGIQLIQVGGASAGVFTLAGRAVGGQYEYFLHQGTTAAPTEGNWYLRSELPVVPDPCLADPTLPGCTPVVVPPDPDPCVVNPALPQCQPPIPVLRPEPGAYLANQAAATQMFGMRLSDRTGGTARGLSDRGAWARVSRNQADYGVIADQLSVNGDTSVLQVGTDLLSWGADSRGQFGVMLGGGRANNTVTSRETGYSAKGKVEGQAVGIYASWLQDPAQTTGLYVDAWAQYAQFKNTVQGDALTKERYDSDAKTASVEAGYSFKLLDSSSTAMFLEPQLQLSYTDFSADHHVETNGTVIDGSDAGGLTSRVGVRLFGHANSDIGNRVQPFVAVNWIHGADDNSLRFDGDRLEGGLPKDRYEAKAGASLQLGQRWTAWGDMGLQKGQGGYRDVAGQIGLRASW